MRELTNVVVAVGMVAKAIVALLLRVVGVFTDTLYDFTMFIASDIVDADRSNDTKARRVQLFVVYPITILLLAVMAGVFLSNELPRTQECTFKECHCYEGYDIWGDPIESPYAENYCCTVHGHDCPQED